MLYTVEVHLDEEADLATSMAGMRQWLDQRRYEPDVFQYSGSVIRVEFKFENEASAFAEAFSGSIR